MALKHVTVLAPSAALIPEADPSQAVLESSFFNSAEEPPTRDRVRAVVVPTIDEWGEVRGIPGARFTVTRGGILIRRLNKPGFLTIVGIPAEGWDAAVDLPQRPDRWRLRHRNSPGRPGVFAHLGPVRSIGICASVLCWRGCPSPRPCALEVGKSTGSAGR